MIYLDNAATTKPMAEALSFAEQYNDGCFFNPSALYRGGIDAKRAVNEAREKIERFFPKDREVLFTSCGSEADNTAVFSFAKRGVSITTLGEHSAVYECFNELKTRGFPVGFAPIKADGGVDAEKLVDMVDDGTGFVSVVHVNNETGAINDINAIAKAVKKKNPSVIFHSDGVQAFGKIPFSMSDYIDMYSVSAHKIGGIKGVGALIKKKKLTVHPLIFGGGQENGLRSGTENVFGISVFGYSAARRYEKLAENFDRVSSINATFRNLIDKNNIEIISSENSSPYVLSLSAVGLRGEVIQHMLEDYGIIIGTGSACSSRRKHSRILKECGFGDKVLDGALRVSFSPETSKEEVVFAVEKINECVAKLKGVMAR